jgi:hypothetical protein
MELEENSEQMFRSAVIPGRDNGSRECAPDGANPESRGSQHLWIPGLRDPSRLVPTRITHPGMTIVRLMRYSMIA